MCILYTYSYYMYLEYKYLRVCVYMNVCVSVCMFACLFNCLFVRVYMCSCVFVWTIQKIMIKVFHCFIG